MLAWLFDIHCLFLLRSAQIVRFTSLIGCNGDAQTCLGIGARTSKSTFKVGSQLVLLPSYSEELIVLLDNVGSLLTQVYHNPSTAIQDALVPIKQVLISEVLINQTDLDIQISLSSCFSELIQITTLNPPFEDQLMKKAFRVIVSPYQAIPKVLTNHTIKDFAYLDIFHSLLASIKDDQSYCR